MLPGGHHSAGLPHVEPAVYRRAARHAVAAYCAMGDQKGLSLIDLLLVYLNRLSDCLFALARRCNVAHGLKDTVCGAP
ncbi:MAG: hypothetical protein LLG06_19165 [Desulfobacteraceae bacterium]|nr:hypothetical protein [Desulfobacteraceae bacterium]